MKRTSWVVYAILALLALGGCAPGVSSTTIKPTSTTPPTPTATVDALKTPLPSQGWVTVQALDFAKGIAFSKSDPLTGYACGNIGILAVRTPADVLQLSVTHDGGRTWSAPVATTVPGAGCDFSINPGDANDLVMMAWRCYGDCNPVPSPYRSHDGGKTWEALKLDPTQWQNAGTNWIESDPAWVGNTAFFAMVAPGAHGPIPQPQHTVVSNTTGGVLSATDAGIYSLITNPEAYPETIWASGSTLGVSFTGANYVKSTDGGVTWRKYTPSLPSSSYVISSTDGVLVAGNGKAWQVSSDGGATWRSLPALPPTSSAYNVQGLFHVPDGTFLVVGPVNVWRLAPGAPAWRNATKMVTDQYGIPAQVLAFSTDASGHPILAWSQASRAVVNGILQPGIAYHGLA